jgi:hypothetical protein
MEIGNYYTSIICESFLDNETGRIRIRTIPCDVIPQSLMVESLKIFRERYPLGTKFNTTQVKICKKPDGRIYARAEDQMLYVLE